VSESFGGEAGRVLARGGCLRGLHFGVEACDERGWRRSTHAVQEGAAGGQQPAPGPESARAPVARGGWAEGGSWLDPGLRERLVAFARRHVGEGDAEDLAQETLVRVGRNLGRLRSEARADAWMFRICRHAAIDHLRSRKVRRGLWVDLPVDVADWAVAPEAELAPRGVAPERPALPDLEDLPAHQGLLLSLHHVRGLSQARLCLLTGLTAPALRVRLFRARRVLARRLAE
jgi:RNA polymerase sigma-70 factor (ECF subfamily)